MVSLVWGLSQNTTFPPHTSNTWEELSWCLSFAGVSFIPVHPQLCFSSCFLSPKLDRRWQPLKCIGWSFMRPIYQWIGLKFHIIGYISLYRAVLWFNAMKISLIFFSQYNIEYKGHKLNVEEKKPRGERTHSGSRPGIRRDGPRFNHRGGRGGGFGGPPREDSGNRDQGRFSNVNKANMNRR